MIISSGILVLNILNVQTHSPKVQSVLPSCQKWMWWGHSGGLTRCISYPILAWNGGYAREWCPNTMYSYLNCGEDAVKLYDFPLGCEVSDV